MKQDIDVLKHECGGATNARWANVQARMQRSCECPLGECESTNAAELRMPGANVLKHECGGAAIVRAGCVDETIRLLTNNL